jgi:hypothetical protein
VVIDWGTIGEHVIVGTWMEPARTLSHLCITHCKQTFGKQAFAGIFIFDNRPSRVFQPNRPSVVPVISTALSQNRSLGFMEEWVFERNQKSPNASMNHWHFVKEPTVSRAVI